MGYTENRKLERKGKVIIGILHGSTVNSICIRKEGREEGREESREEGREEGRKEGRKRKKRKNQQYPKRNTSTVVPMTHSQLGVK